MATPTIPMETIIRDIGGCGRYQILLSLIVHAMKSSTCFSTIAMVFGSAVPDWWCDDDVTNSGRTSSNETEMGNATLFKSCVTSTGARCVNFVFRSNIRTVVTEWGLVCDQAWIPSSITSVQMGGVFLGTIICGHVADAIGRKKPLFISLAILLVFNVVATFSVSWVMFAVVRFFIGIGIGFFIVVQYNIQSEFTLAKWRAVVVAIPSWAVESCLFALVVYLCKDWQIMHIVTAALAFPFLFAWWFIPESFRWYVANDRVTEAESVISRIAGFNGRGEPNMQVLQSYAEAEKEEKSTRASKFTILDLFKTRYLLKLTLLLILNWIALAMVAYGIQFGVQALSGDLYINIFVFAIVTSPVNIACMYLNNRLGRRRTALVCFAITALAGLVVGILQQVTMDTGLRNSLVNAFALIGYIANCGAWPPMQTLTLEAYPTVVRNIGYGFQNMWARIGAVIGPQLVYLDSKFPGVMYFVCAAVSFLCLFTTYPLPETKDLDLQDKLEEKGDVDNRRSETITF